MGHPPPNQMEQRVLNTRTVKVAGEGGLESMITVVIDSLHFESHLIATNCGPLGLKGEVEPSTNRAALSDRSWAHLVPPAADDDKSADADFDLQSASEDVKAQVNKFRVHSCLVAYVLIYIKHIPSCKPNLTYANMLCNKWYEMLDLEYNIPKPTKRKKIKLRMMLELFAVESAVYEKFMLPESGVDFADMRPDEDGHLSAFCIEQLADVVRSLQRCLDHEAIVTAWSHSLDHSTATCAHVHQMMATLSALVGNDFDRRTLDGDMPRPPPSAEESYDDECCSMMDQLDASRDAAAAATETEQQGAPLGPRGGGGRGGGASTSNEEGSPNDENGKATLPGAKTKDMMSTDMTRQKCANFAKEMEVQRMCRSEMSNRALVQKLDGSCDAYAQLTKLFTDGRDKNKEPMHRIAATGQIISAKRAAGACMPNVSDVLSRGMTEGFLKNIMSGMEAKSGDFKDDEARVGTNCNNGWEYKRLSGASQPGPADFDFSWARITSPGTGKAVRDSGDAPAGGASTGANKKSIWVNSARAVKNATKSGTSRAFTMMDAESMSFESMRDTLFIINGSDNKRRIPQSSQSQRFVQASQSRMLSKNEVFTEGGGQVQTIHPHCMFVPDPTNGTCKLDPKFEVPVGVQRPVGSTVCMSDYQKRLDHLTQHRALPACIAPESYKRGTPIEECEELNGIYFNKHVASEQANLVVEIAHYLSTVPGIAGGTYHAVPDTFKAHDERGRPGARDGNGATLRAARKAVNEEDAEATGGVANEPVMEDGDAEDAPSPAAPHAALPVDDNDNSDLNSIDSGVRDPNSGGFDQQPVEGAAAAAAARTADPNAKTRTLPYEWDQFGMFATFKAIDTLHNDCKPYVDIMRAKFPDVFEDEDADVTMADLPQVCMRFPGIKEKHKMLFPLSRGLPLKESRYCNMDTHIKSARAGKELTEAVHSFAQGRAIAYNDPEVSEHEAMARGIESGFSLKGNLFSRSAWQRFTLSALDARGMLTPEEVGRVNDQGLCLRLRVRNHRAAQCHEEADPALEGCTLAIPKSFGAQERRKRERGGEDAGLCDVELCGSTPAKRRALEAERNQQMLNDAGNLDPKL